MNKAEEIVECLRATGYRNIEVKEKHFASLLAVCVVADK